MLAIPTTSSGDFGNAEEGEVRMYATFVEINTGESDLDAARETLRSSAVPRARESGARAAYWLAPGAGRGITIVVFDSEESARRLAARFEVGQSPPAAPGAPPATVKSVEVREVLASLD
jgi:hypothetical protein